MEVTQIVELESEKVNILSNSISNFINKVNDIEGIEGMFLFPCINFKEFKVILLEIVTSDYRTRKRVFERIDGDFEIASLKTGIDIKTGTISYDEYQKNVDTEDCNYPIRGMLCSGQIIYDPNGELESLQKRFQGDERFDNLDKQGVVKIEPSIQYTKK